MSGEPKTLTLEEALVLIARDTQYSLVAMPDEDSDEPVALSWVLLGAFDDFGPFTSWVQAAEYALGVPVVARDEAAEPKPIGWDDVTEEHVVGAFLDAQAEAHRYRNALEALLNSVHRGIYDAAWALEAVANAEALISPGLDDDYRKAKAQEAYERRLAGGEDQK